MSKYLNLDGLGTFWDKIKSTFVKSVKITSSGSELKTSDGNVVIPVASEWGSSPSNSVIPSEKLVNSSIYKNGENRFIRDGTDDATIGTKGWFKLAETSLTDSSSFYTISGRWDCNFISYRNIISNCCIDLCLYKSGKNNPLSVRKSIIHCDPYKTLPIELCVRYNSVDTDAATVPLVVEIWGKLTSNYIGTYLKESASARNSRYGYTGTYNNWTYYDVSNTESSLGSEKPTPSGNFNVVNFVKHYELSSEAGTAIGASNTPVYIGSDGTVTAGSTYAAGTAVTLNGTSKSASTASFYAPTTAGSSGQLLKSSGSGASPTWATANAALVGITVTPTSVSDGISTCTNTDTKVTQTKDDSGTTAYPLLMAGATNPDGSATTARYDSNVKLTPSTNTISANISGNAATATSATNVNLVGDVKTKSTTNGDTIRVKAGSGTAAEITIVNAKHAASADSATSATTATNSTKSAVTADTGSKLYLIGAAGSSGQQALKTDTGIYATTESGELHATRFDVNGGCTLQYNSTTKSLDFVFA